MKLLPAKFRRKRRTPPSGPHTKIKIKVISPYRKWYWLAGLVVTTLALYFWFTSARIVSERVELAYGPDDPLFVSSLGPLLGAEFTPGNRVDLLANGDEFFPAMLADIAKAKKTITLESYIWASGDISNRFIAALADRARHGVKVHVLVDGMGALKFDDADQLRLINAGVEFIMYGREHWYEVKPNINHRTHRKLLIIDGRVGYTGGVCVDDKWLGNATQRDHWRETQMRVEGPVVRQMQSVFNTNWVQTTGRLLVGPDYFPVPEPPARGSLAQCYKSGPHEDPENARMSYLLAIASARKSIQISHAYFVPDDLAMDMLLAARHRGVKIQVIIPAHNDSRFGRAASRSRWGKLLEAGVEFYAYDPAMYHCKIMIVDDVFLTIGSVNFDNRSFGINDEVNINVVDHGVVRAGRRLFEDDMKHSHALTLDEFRARPAWQKAIDHFCGLFRSQL
ncbi:MAG TPA: cardiolipin synthase [Lacunisphaera sp.]|nr:cardiolipin synthase [Lacunisphaera sp.]